MSYCSSCNVWLYHEQKYHPVDDRHYNFSPCPLHISSTVWHSHAWVLHGPEGCAVVSLNKHSLATLRQRSSHCCYIIDVCLFPELQLDMIHLEVVLVDLGVQGFSMV